MGVCSPTSPVWGLQDIPPTDGGLGGGCQPTVSRQFGVTPPPSVAGLVPCGPPGGGRVEEEVYRGYLGGREAGFGCSGVSTPAC